MVDDLPMEATIEEDNQKDEYQIPLTDFKKYNIPESFGKKSERAHSNMPKEEEEEKYTQWKENERKFYLHQTKLKSQIRMQQHRELPIDYFVKLCDVFQGNLQPSKDFLDIGYDEPHKSLENLTEVDLENLKEELMIYNNLEKEEEFKSYWFNVGILIEFYIEKIKMGQNKDSDEFIIYRDGIDDTVEDQIRKLINNKGEEELKALEKLIDNNIMLPQFQMNLQFWISIRKQLKISKVKAYFKETYQNFVHKHQLDKQMYDEFGEDNSERVIPEGYRSPPRLGKCPEFETKVILMDEYPKLLKQMKKKILGAQIDLCQKISAQPLITNAKSYYEYVRFSVEDDDWEDTCNAIYKQECERPMSEDEFP